MKDLIKYGDECFEFDSFGMVKPPETRHWERVLRTSQDDMHTLRLSKPAFFREPDAPVLVDCTQLFRTLKTRVYSTDAAIEVSKKLVASRYWTCRRALKQENSKKITVAECENFMPRDSLHNLTELLQQKMDQDCIAIMRQLTWHEHVQLCDAQHLTLKKEKLTQSGNTSSSCRHREAAARLIEDMSVLIAPSLDQALSPLHPCHLRSQHLRLSVHQREVSITRLRLTIPLVNQLSTQFWRCHNHMASRRRSGRMWRHSPGRRRNWHCALSLDTLRAAGDDTDDEGGLPRASDDKDGEGSVALSAAHCAWSHQFLCETQTKQLTSY